VFENPQHAYTRKLMAAVPVADPRAAASASCWSDEIPSPIRALGDAPVAPLVQVAPGHFVAAIRSAAADLKTICRFHPYPDNLGVFA
jgi:glutathione transport system ATP-binding protein